MSCSRILTSGMWPGVTIQGWGLLLCSPPTTFTGTIVQILHAWVMFHHLRNEVDQLYSKVKDTSGWMTSWNMKHSFSSPWRVHQIMGKASFLPRAVRDLEIQTKRVLALYLGNLQHLKLYIFPFVNGQHALEIGDISHSWFGGRGLILRQT